MDNASCVGISALKATVNPDRSQKCSFAKEVSCSVFLSVGLLAMQSCAKPNTTSGTPGSSSSHDPVRHPSWGRAASDTLEARVSSVLLSGA